MRQQGRLNIRYRELTLQHKTVDYYLTTDSSVLLFNKILESVVDSRSTATCSS